MNPPPSPTVPWRSDRCFVIAELGINHNGSIDLAKRLATAAKEAGADAVKLQTRDPELATPEHRKNVLRFSCTTQDPNEQITELQHRKNIELSKADLEEFSRHCSEIGVVWFSSPWDVPSVALLESLNVPFYKIASACITNPALLQAIRATGKPIIASTGMSTQDEVDALVEAFKGYTTSAGEPGFCLLHTCSAYPAENDQINLRVMETLRARYGLPVGYSGHERGVQISVAAVALGACVIERHFTLDRTMRGSDHAASLEPGGFKTLVRDIRVVEAALGSPVKTLLECEKFPKAKLRAV